MKLQTKKPKENVSVAQAGSVEDYAEKVLHEL